MAAAAVAAHAAVVHGVAAAAVVVGRLVILKGEHMHTFLYSV